MKKHDVFKSVIIASAFISGPALLVLNGQEVAKIKMAEKKATEKLADCLQKTPAQTVMTEKQDITFRTKATARFHWVEIVLTDAKPKEACLTAGGRDGCIANTIWYNYDIRDQEIMPYQDNLQASLNPHSMRSLAMQRLNQCVTGYRLPAHPR